MTTFCLYDGNHALSGRVNHERMKTMNENKICPLLCACPADIPTECLGDRCAWYVPPRYPGMEGRCAVQALPDLAAGVRRL